MTHIHKQLIYIIKGQEERAHFRDKVLLFRIAAVEHYYVKDY